MYLKYEVKSCSKKKSCKHCRHGQVLSAPSLNGPTKTNKNKCITLSNKAKLNMNKMIGK